MSTTFAEQIRAVQARSSVMPTQFLRDDIATMAEKLEGQTVILEEAGKYGAESREYLAALADISLTMLVVTVLTAELIQRPVDGGPFMVISLN